MDSDKLFITGTPRSGTTLLDKLLSVPGKSRIVSQPLPLFFSSLKEIFLQGKGVLPGYPLNDMFLSNYYDQKPWQDFLSRYCISRDQFSEIASSMRSFSGQYTRPIDLPSFLDTYEPQKIDGFLDSYLSWFVPRDYPLRGLKETWCEEYVPFLAERGFKCLLIVRDPRDVVTSLNYGDGHNYGGRTKPLLYNLRSWRKSVAIGLHMASHPRFKLVRYEELVRDPVRVMAQLFEFLCLDTGYEEFSPDRVADQDGQTWHSNSSHQSMSGISPASVGKYADHLPISTTALIETLCFPEMQLLGYTTAVSAGQLEGLLSKTNLREHSERLELVSYLWSEERLKEESDRIRYLRDGEYRPSYFLFKRAFSQLRRAL